MDGRNKGVLVGVKLGASEGITVGINEGTAEGTTEGAIDGSILDPVGLVSVTPKATESAMAAITTPTTADLTTKEDRGGGVEPDMEPAATDAVMVAFCAACIAICCITLLTL
jgi:hypothetical protein